MTHRVEFLPDWVNAPKMENTLQSCGGPHETSSNEILFCFPPGCKIMIDAGIRLLSLFNQLDHCCRRVILDFEEGEAGTMGYLNRMGFFDHLSSNVEVRPQRPAYSGAVRYSRTNDSLVEIARINPEHENSDLPSRLTDTLMRCCDDREDAEPLGGAAWTIFAELIGNIFAHSETLLDGYAALQLYRGGDNLSVAVSDSGLGIMETLRPTLEPSFAHLSDTELLVEIFRQGISRHGTDRGCGLKGSAAKAIKFKAELDVRLPTSRVLLVPGKDGYRPTNTAYCSESLPLIWGTHICFKFLLH